MNRIFFLFCLIEAYNSFTEFMLRQEETYATADLWLRLGAFWPLETSIVLHFVLVFSEKTKLLKNTLTYFFLYTPTFVFSLFF